MVETDLPTESAAEINVYEYTFRPDALNSPENAAMREAMIHSGANFANIFREIFRSRKIVTRDAQNNEVTNEVKQLYNDEFFKDYLNIEPENINEFIFFAEDAGLTPRMLEEENELELIDFLVEQSRRYRERKVNAGQ